DPTFPVHNSVYYCVANMPGAVPNTATAALTNATLPFAVKIADQGWHEALSNDSALARGLNIHNGHVTNDNVADAFDLEAVSVAHALANCVRIRCRFRGSLGCVAPVAGACQPRETMVVKRKCSSHRRPACSAS